MLNSLVRCLGGVEHNETGTDRDLVILDHVSDLLLLGNKDLL